MRFIVLALALLCSIPAHAHILLTTAYGVTGPVGIASSSALHATAVSNTYTWGTNTACVTYAIGTATFTGSQDTAFVASSTAPTVQFCLNLTSGAWTASLSQIVPGVNLTNSSGTMTGATLTTANSIYTGPVTALRNAADLFAAQNFLPGTQPATW